MHGFLNKKSIVSNARQHIGNSILLKLDIRNFFDSITVEDIETHFDQMKIKSVISQTLSSFLTINGKLVQGFCTSPLISNLIFEPIDRLLLDLSNKYGSVYTRYADDITFSSNKYTPDLNEINSIICEGGFKLDEKKILRKKRGQAFYVTGLSISEQEPKVPKNWKHKLRQEMYYIKKHGFSEHVARRDYTSIQSCVNSLQGKINFLHAVEPELAKRFKTDLNEMLKSENLQTGFKQMEVNNNTFNLYIDECEINNCLCLCLVVVENVNLVEKQMEGLLVKLRQKSFIPRLKKMFENKGFHWNDLSISIRQELISLVGKLPFRAYIACKNKEGNFRSSYDCLFCELLKLQFIRLAGSRLEIFVENHNQLTNSRLQKISDNLFDQYEKLGLRRPSNVPIIKLLEKNVSHCLSLPDCLLGVFHGYVLSLQTKKNDLQYSHQESFFDIILPKLMNVSVYEVDKFKIYREKKGLKISELWSYFKFNIREG